MIISIFMKIARIVSKIREEEVMVHKFTTCPKRVENLMLNVQENANYYLLSDRQPGV